MKKGNSKRVLAGFLALLLVATSFSWDFGETKAAETTSAGTEAAHVKYNFVNMSAEDKVAVESDFKAFVENSTEAKQFDELWSSGAEGLRSTKTGTGYWLRYNRAYKNFKATIKIKPEYNIAIVVGDANKITPAAKDDPAFQIWASSATQINYRGAGKDMVSKSGLQLGDSQEYTINIRLENGKISVWIEETGTEFVNKIAVNSEFPDEVTIAFRFNRSATASEKGGYKSLEVQDLDAVEEGYVDFDYIDPITLQGYTATQFDKSDNYAILGQNQPVDTYWFSGKSATVNGTTLSSGNTGLKSNATEAAGTAQIMTTPYAYKDFKLSTEVYYGVNTGVIVGPKNVYPRTVADYSSISVIFANNRLQLGGAFDYSTAKVTGEDAGAWSVYQTNTGIFVFDKTRSNTNPLTTNGVYKLNMYMLAGELTVWVDGYDALLTVCVADHYEAGNVTLVSHRYNNVGGGFKSLAVEDATPDSYEYDFKNVDVAELEKAGFTSTMYNRGDSSYAVVGEPEQKVSEHWFSGAYSSTSGVTAPTTGLKTKSPDSEGRAVALNVPYVYENYKMSAEIHYGYGVGIMIGPKNTYATASSNAIRAYFANSQVQIGGAADFSTVNGTPWSTSGTTGIFRPAALSGNTTYTLNMQMKNGVVTIWLDGYSGGVSFKVAERFQAENIALVALKYNQDGGGIESLKVQNLDAEKNQVEKQEDFNFIDPAVLSQKGFTSTRFDIDNNHNVVEGAVDQPVESHWFSGNGSDTPYGTAAVATKNIGLKTNVAASHRTRTVLNTPYKYENFKVSLSVYWGADTGIVVGEKNVFPMGNAGESGFRIYFNANQLQIIGTGLNYSTATVVGGTGTFSGSGPYLFKPASDYTRTRAAVYKLNIELLDGILSVSLDGYESVLKVAVSDTFKNENIGLISRQYDGDGGGLCSFEIQELERILNTGTTVDVDGYTDFDYVNTAVFDEKGFTATQFNTSGYSVAGEVDQPVSAYWAAGKDVPSGNIGLKPKVTASESKMTILNTPYTYENFRISTEVYWGANTGIVLGAKNVFPTSNIDSGVRIYFNANQIQLVGGGLDYDSKVVSGSSATWNFGYAPSYIFKPAADFTPSDTAVGEVYKLNVEMKDGILTVWVDGYDGVLTIKTKETFKQESIALMARNYDGDGGGLKSLKVEELEDIVMSYTAEQFASCRSGDTYTAPEYKDYLFAGWFTDQACGKESAIAVDAKTVETTVYAKFVPRYVLDVKAQISAHLSDTNPTDDGTGAIRFVTSIDTLNYSQVGFNISYDKGDGNGIQNKTSASNKVYKELFATIGDTNSETIEYNPKIEFCKTSEFFKACTVRNISADLYDMEFTVTPFWETMDGTIVNGDAVVKTVDQGINSVKLNGKTALFIGDSIQAGHNTSDDQAGYTLKGWAQRLERYGLVSENVAQKGWALTNKDISGRSQIVTQLDSATKTDYDFVILEGGVNDVRIDQDTQNPDITIDWGTINEDPNAAFTDDNIAGAMQDLIVKTQAKFPNAKIVYIINHYFGANATNMKNYVAMVKDACRVHDIDYIDLSDTESYPTLEPLTQKSAEYIPDNLHPSAAGYELSTPIIATCLRKLATGEVADTVYVSAAGTDSKGYGTKENPYQSLNYAVNQVADGGTVYVQGTVASGYNFTGSTGVKSYYLGGAEKDTEKTNAKQITIKGEDATSSLIDFSGAAQLRFNMAVTLENIQVKWPTSRIYAEGNRFTVADTVVQTADSSTAAVFGGSATHDVDRTDVKLYAGDYKVIVGGQVSRNVGETHLTLGKKVNSKADPTSHDFWTGYRVYGGSYSEGAAATVTGDTYVTIEDGAKMNWLFGAGGIGGDNIKTKSVVNGETHVELKGGEVYGIYGGGYSNTAAKTHVVVTGGTVYQIFGGNQEYDMTGDTDVQILGGTIKRRVYGGNYNNYEDGNWKGAFKVTGNTSVAIGPNAVFSFTDNDQGIFACSRYGSAFESEKGTVIFLDNCYNSKNGYLGSQDLAGGIVVGTPKYHYLVNAGTNGKVYAAGNSIKVIPNDGYTAVVTSDGTALEQNADGSYALPDLGSAASKTINVTFNAN